ncbi:MAG: hypothetical protein V4505_00440 [Pseudomonadota bacterium]
MGVTSASTPLRIVRAHDTLMEQVRVLAESFCEPEGLFLSTMKKLAVETPIVDLSITPQGIAVLEAQSNHGFFMPERRGSHRPTSGGQFKPGAIHPGQVTTNGLKVRCSPEDS